MAHNFYDTQSPTQVSRQANHGCCCWVFAARNAPCTAAISPGLVVLTSCTKLRTCSTRQKHHTTTATRTATATDHPKPAGPAMACCAAHPLAAAAGTNVSLPALRHIPFCFSPLLSSTELAACVAGQADQTTTTAKHAAICRKRVADSLLSTILVAGQAIRTTTIAKHAAISKKRAADCLVGSSIYMLCTHYVSCCVFC
jgi:hypothetical protein